MQVWSTTQHWWFKGPALLQLWQSSQLWLGSDPWSGNFHASWVQPKKKKVEVSAMMGAANATIPLSAIQNIDYSIIDYSKFRKFVSVLYSMSKLRIWRLIFRVILAWCIMLHCIWSLKLTWINLYIFKYLQNYILCEPVINDRITIQKLESVVSVAMGTLMWYPLAFI